MRPVRLGLVGAGRIAQTYVEVIHQSDDAEIVAVADVDSVAAGKLAAEIGCAAFDNHDALGDAPNLEAVLIWSPPNTHQEIAVQFLERGLHVMCEKPLALTVEDARRMLKQMLEPQDWERISFLMERPRTTAKTELTST